MTTTYRDCTMKILVLGGGGREHALVWGLRQNGETSKIFCAPGNGGIARHAECIPANLDDVSGLADLAQSVGADLTIVGPEQPLVLGVAAEFEKRGLLILAPSQSCARLEGSKVFAKEFLVRHGIPTATAYGVCDTAATAHKILDTVTWPAVLKADGLCAGKGVLVAQSREEAEGFVDLVLEKRAFGAGGSRLLIEAALIGTELSFIILADGERFVPLAPCRDHKRAFDGDQGPNTGGMGVYSCDEIVSPSLQETILESIVRPTMAGLAQDGETYRGFLYFGLMLTPDGPSVLEFNCRMGDPEAQAIIPRADFDWAAVLASAARGDLRPLDVEWIPGASVCVVLASGGYPGSYATGKEILGLNATGTEDKVAVFHAGTRAVGDKYYTCSGRVLGVTGTAPSLAEARNASYGAVRRIHFDGMQFRSDIALEASRNSSRIAKCG